MKTSFLQRMNTNRANPMGTKLQLLQALSQRCAPSFFVLLNQLLSDRLIIMEFDIFSKMDTKLLQSIEGKKKELDRYRPFPSAIIQKLHEQFIIEWTYNSNAIEGNTLSLQETELVINRGLAIGNKPLKGHIEAINHKSGIMMVEKFNQIPLSKLRGMQGKVYKKLIDNFALPGCYHNFTTFEIANATS